MTKYWPFLCQIFLLMKTFFLLCMSDPGVSETPKTNCSIEEYGIQSEDGQLKCIPCTALPTCQHGLGISVVCGSIVSKKTHIHCVPCVRGKTFSASSDNKPCQRCQSLDCHPNEKVLGKCEVDKDTSKCSGICEKGFYSNTGRLDHCQPCSLCSNNDSTAVVKKCKDDGIPNGKQCKVPSPAKPSVRTSKLFSTTKTECKDQKYGSQGYKSYHARFVSLVVVISILSAVTCILAILLWKQKHRKKTYSSEEGQASPSGVGNESVENQSDQGEVALASCKGKSSSGSTGSQKVYYTKQDSNSNTDEMLLPASEQQDKDKDDVFDEQLDTQKTRERIRKLSSSSGNKYRFSFMRQNSNPIPEHQEEKAFLKRRNTFSNFTSLLNTDPKIKGNKEETASLLFSADDSDDDMPTPPPEAPSSLGESNRIFNSSPMPEHVGNSETTSTDQNDNDILPDVVMLPPSSSSAPHRLSGVKVREMNAEIYLQLCNMLSLEIHNKDWRTLAGRMKYSNQQVKEFANPDKLLDHWGVKDGNDVARLIDLARGLGRDDIVKLLESAETYPTNF
ncbi:uncharacterized protein LOC114533581 [Dendronephthya gigantea]|uniref:uncharacterized protein LOC114533581 n=1 Tax=Dendronephthya gigantea TaxID=151771 RepID=UPI00106D57F8|nr:uncharacterized protein LOC114533581 [Dendronephthya gigantea]